MTPKRELPHESIITALNAVKTRDGLAELVTYVASTKFQGGHEEIAEAIDHANQRVTNGGEPWLDPLLYGKALDNLADQRESSQK